MSSDLPKKEDVLFLTSVSYNETKKEVLVEFSNKSTRVVERFKFYPFFRLPNNLDSSKLKELILSFGIKGFSLVEKSSFYYLHASSFGELKKIANVLGNCFGKLPLVIEPERQFLLEKGWTYFDSFIYFSNSLVKVDSFSKDVSFAVLPEIPFSQALKIDESHALFSVEQASLSSILSVPLHLVPREAKDREELFLENIFFKNAEFILWEKQESLSSYSSVPFGFFDKVSVMDFSPIWAQLFSKSFFNVGPETKNCSCCKAFTLDDKNILPSSLIEVVVNDDNFFFESSSPSFAKEFDKIHDGKSLRIEKKKEYFLKEVPIGPLNFGERVLLPLLDAKNLLNEGSVSLGQNHKVEWFCLKEESFFSKEISSFSSKLSSFSQVSSFFQEKLFDFGFEKLFAQYYVKNLSYLVAEIPFQLMNSSSKFQSVSLAKTIIGIQEATLFKFREFSEKNGYRVIHADKRSAFVKGYSSLALAKKFSSELSLPCVPIKGFSSGQRLHK